MRLTKPVYFIAILRYVRQYLPLTTRDCQSAVVTKLEIPTLSLIFALLGSATNLLHSLRYHSVAITPVIALVLVHPLGRLWDRLLKRDDDPAEAFEDGALVRRLSTSGADYKPSSQLSRFRIWLAQGTWNENEHACVYISSNVLFGFAFATGV